MKRVFILCFLFVNGILLLLDLVTPLEINNSVVYSALLFFFLSALIIVLAPIIFKIKHKKVIFFLIAMAGILCFAKNYFQRAGDWKTQTINFQNLHFKNRTIELQMQDLGALGYNRRTVDRIKMFPFFDWINPVGRHQINTMTWKKVEIDVNELGLKN